MFAPAAEDPADLEREIDLAIARIDTIAVPIVLRRIEEMGEEESGASNFYAVRARRGTIFADYDRALTLALARWPVAPRSIVEIGGGIGGFSMLAAVAGFDCLCVEFNPHRVGLAEELVPAIEAVEPSIGRRFRFLRAKFPHDKAVVPGAMAVATNFVTGSNDADRTRVYDAMAAHGWSIIDVDRFMDRSHSREDTVKSIRAIEDAGMVGTPFLDLGESANFWRFRGQI